MADFGRRLLLTHEGRVLLACAYAVAAIVSIVTYGIMRSPEYAVGQLVVTSIGLGWARWCLRRA